ncbi:hypothetical protein J2858_003234 [Neorhizobium galegae]|uniref:AGROH133_08824 family phage infection protein n=1 Tax=Neorhizobium galegae TaxID=399 RepID=UPI001AE84527|nr:DUF4345 domain-containing protein [Neorhizobium galegae]MBP2550298.1 hypothetical protein [Neorhizobium galegae]
MELYFPTELPEQLAFLGAALSALAGLFILLLPASALRLSGFAIGEVTPEGYGSVRSTGGLYLGLGVIAIFLAQDWTYLALGVAAAMGAFGRLVSMVADRGLTLRNGTLLLLQVVVAVLPLGYVLGYF